MPNDLLPILPAIRCSSLPAAFKCGGSVRQPLLPVDEVNEAADMGTAAHEASRPLAEGRGIQWEELPALAKRHGVSLEELRMLCGIVQRLWPQIAEHFPLAETEVALEFEVLPGVILSGHLDVAVTAAFLDWKFGRVDRDYSQQINGYSALKLLADPTLEKVDGHVVWVRDGELESYSMDRAQLAEWLEDLRAKVVEWDGVYRPGPHCPHCRRSHECKAANALARRDMAALLDQDDATDLTQLAPEAIVAILEGAKRAAAIGERVKKAIKDYVAAHGPVVSDAGTLSIKLKPRREVDTVAAWTVLQDAGFQDEDFAEVIKISLSKAEKHIAAKAGKGKGAGAIRQLGAALEAANAVRQNPTEELSLTR